MSRSSSVAGLKAKNMATLLYFSIVLLASVNTEEVATPSNLLGPRNFNHHPYESEQYLKETEPTQQGPVLFPNDAPPPPRPPLIVTSRPLTESIARSELNQSPPENNTIASSSSINRVSFKPDFLSQVKPEFRTRIKPEYLIKPTFLAKVKDYRPYAFPVVTTEAPFDYGSYGDVAENSRFNGVGPDNRYSDYEVQPTLPPIYKALSDHANQKVLKIKQKQIPQNHNYQVREPAFAPQYHNNDGHGHDDNADHNQGSNYAFSYTVKDHKTGDDFSHSQHSSGSATNGEYRVRLPDGRMQIVSYTADENGYNAKVRYDNDEYKTSGNSIDNDYNHNRHDYDKTRREFDRNADKAKYHNAVTAIDNGYNDNHNEYQTVHDYNDNTHDYVQNRAYDPIDFKAPNKEDYNQYSDTSKEYYNNDYSLEYGIGNDKYEPHRSKFSSFTPKPIAVPNQFQNKNFVSSTTVRPSYEELKGLFVHKNLYNPPSNYKLPVEINVPSTTPDSNIYDVTTERVVVIGGSKPHLYTNIRNIPLSVTPAPLLTPSSFVTPESYLLSTVNNLKNRAGEKVVLSNSFINRINKYLTFNK